MKILFATDGSSHADHALSFLSRFPFASPPSIKIVTVCPVSDMHAIGPGVPEAVNEVVDQCRREGSDLLERTRTRCAGWSSDVQTLLLDGHPAKEILNLLSEETPDLVVLGARGLGAVQRFVLGSVSERIARYAPCSVLVVRPTADEESSIEPGRILIGDDGSPAAAAAVQRFAGFPLGETRQVTVHCVLETVHYYGMAVSLESEPEWQEYTDVRRKALDQHAQRLRQATPNVKTSLTTSADAADNLIDFAEAEQADLIVVGGSQKGRFAQWLLGTVSLHVLHHAPCSVWIERTTAT